VQCESANVRYCNINAYRQKIQPTLTDVLKRIVRTNGNVGISKDWVSAGRPCAPRMLFVFEGCLVNDNDLDGTTAGRSRSQVVVYNHKGADVVLMFFITFCLLGVTCILGYNQYNKNKAV